jgi:YVTN family beta-propeller protein/VCBS repeat-containing protein
MGNAKYIGRVGVLAVALGIGTALATTPGVSAAEPSADSSSSSSTDSSGSSSASSSSDSSSNSSDSPSESGPESSATESSTASGSAGSSLNGDESSTEPDDAGTDSAPGDDAESEAVVSEPVELGPPESEAVVGEPATEPEPASEPLPVTAPEPDSDGDHPVSVPRAASTLVGPSAAAGRAPSTPSTSAEESAKLVSGAEAAMLHTDVSAAQPSVVAVQDVPADAVAPVTPASPVTVVSGLLAWVGLGPGAGTGPVAPALVLASAFVRRELQQAVEAQFPTIGLAATPTSQSLGLLGGVLHLLYNNTPTNNYNPANNIQLAHGVVAGDINAADIDGDALIYTVSQAPQHGSVVVNPDGSFTYTPDADFAQTGDTDTFNVTVSDDTYFHLAHLGGGHTVTKPVAVTVQPINTVIDTITVGDGPTDVAVSPDGTRIYTANAFGDTVSVIDTATNTVIDTITVGPDPAFVAVSPDGTLAYVTNFGDDTVSVIRL